MEIQGLTDLPVRLVLLGLQELLAVLVIQVIQVSRVLRDQQGNRGLQVDQDQLERQDFKELRVLQDQMAQQGSLEVPDQWVLPGWLVNLVCQEQMELLEEQVLRVLQG